MVEVEVSSAQDTQLRTPELSIVMPCLNEAKTVGVCVAKATAYLRQRYIDGEVIVADNGSTDGSQAIAASHGARVVSVASRGYGNALRAGIGAARGKFVIMGDSDDSYDFSALDGFVEKLRAGYDLVLGNRFRGGIAPGAMPVLHKYFGNPVLTLIRLAGVSIEVNTALAAAIAGNFAAIGKAIYATLSLGPRGMRQYLFCSRIVDRVIPRLRALVAGTF